MPNSRTHDLITVGTAAVMAPCALFSGLALPEMGPANAGVLVGSYLASGLLFSPDLDLRSTPYHRWRWLRWVWLPYQKLVPHRSWVSHSFLFGPLLRIAYFAAIMALLTLAALALLNLLTPVDSTGTLLNIATTIRLWLETHPITVAYILAGFVLGGAAHTLADIVVSRVKRMF